MSRPGPQRLFGRVIQGASVLALAGSLMTPSVALADHDKPGEADKTQTTAEPEAPAKPQGTPIQLRPNGPGESAGSTTTNMGLKLLAVAAVLGGAALFLRRRKNTLLQTGALPGRNFTPRVLGRTGIGVRSELLVVDVDGQKLLLGVTPSAVSTLTVLTEEPKEAPLEPELATSRIPTLRDRLPEEPPPRQQLSSMAPRSTPVEESLTRLLAGARATTPHNDESIPASAPPARTRGTRSRNIESSGSISLEGQVRGLSARKRG